MQKYSALSSVYSWIPFKELCKLTVENYIYFNFYNRYNLIKH